MINPMDLLVSDATVNILTARCGESRLAYVEPSTHSKSTFNIAINTQRISDIANDNKTMAQLLYNGLLLHEISHINYRSFNYNVDNLGYDKRKSVILKHIYNIFEDYRIEYKMQMQYPNTSMYFELLRKTFLSAPNKQESKLESYLGAIFAYLRCGVVDDTMLEVVNFIIPIEAVLSDCTPVESFSMASIVFDYLDYLTSPHDNEISYDFKFEKPIDGFSQEQVDEIIEAFEQANELKEDTDGQVASECTELKKAIRECGDTIVDITNSFRVLFEKINTLHTKEGEINILRQQSAYLNSITHDEDYDYIVTDRTYKLDFDFVLIRDISGSIKQHENDYFNSAVSILTALDNFKNVRTCAIAFNDDATIEKYFQNNVFDGRLIKKVTGGTDLATALELLSSLEFKSKNKFILVLTDGDTLNPEHAERLLGGLRSDRNTLLVVLHVGDINDASHLVDSYCNFDNLTETVYTMIYDYINQKGVRAKYE